MRKSNRIRQNKLNTNKYTKIVRKDQKKTEIANTIYTSIQLCTNIYKYTQIYANIHEYTHEYTHDYTHDYTQTDGNRRK